MNTVLVHSGGLKKGMLKAIKVFSGTAPTSFYTAFSLDLSDVLSTYGIRQTELSNAVFVVDIISDPSIRVSDINIAETHYVDGVFAKRINFENPNLAIRIGELIGVRKNSGEQYKEAYTTSVNCNIYLIY